MTKLQTLYKRTKTGKIQEWTICVDGDSFYTIEGIHKGKLTQNKPTVCKGKSIGRANETTGAEQALKEAQAKHDRKTEKNYTPDIKKVDQANDDMHYEPMLAEKFTKHEKKLVYPVITQRKSDGIRAIITKGDAISRNGKQHKTIGHIQKALEPFFKKFPDAILDGELYNHQLHDDFNKIASLIRKQKPTKEELAEAKDMIEFHCYDAPRIGSFTEKDTFLKRYAIMSKELKGVAHVEIVENIMCNSKAEVIAQHDVFVEDGFEGIMIRVDAPYSNKRTKDLLKYKIFTTEEFELTDVREGKGNKIGLAAHADCVMPNGKTFTANVKGPAWWRAELLKNKSSVIGKQATVKYFNLTPDGIPRFPYLLTIRDYE